MILFSGIVPLSNKKWENTFHVEMKKGEDLMIGNFLIDRIVNKCFFNNRRFINR